MWFDDDLMHAELSDGRQVAVPLEWYPRLRMATAEQRSNRGIGGHWEDSDEDLALTSLLRH